MMKTILTRLLSSKQKLLTLAFFTGISCLNGYAQLSQNPDKFLGNITTRYNVDYGKEEYWTLWNQITPENESKWSSIEGSRNSFNWNGADKAFNYAKQHKFPYKFHTLVWGSQYPSWMDNLSTAEQYKAIVEWFDAVKKRYPDLPLIDVVNEAIPGHAPAPYKEALGGDGVTGYDWIIKAFEMAYERWPNAILIYNDYNTFQWNTSQFITLVKTLRDAGAPIDAYGCQSHDLTDMNVTAFKSAMTELQNNLKMPMYSTEYDIGTDNDDLQLQRYQEQIPYMWESSYCAGITLWGYIYGATWTTNGNSGIIRLDDNGNATDRPAMEWLRKYMNTEKAKNAKSPFPGMVKEASVYVKPAGPKVPVGDSIPITVRAKMRTKTIDYVELYIKNQLYETMKEAPYVSYYKPTTQGTHALKAIVYTTDGEKYERVGSFTAGGKRTIFDNNIVLPGTIEAENFDAGPSGIVCYDSDASNTGNARTYRSSTSGVDVIKIGDDGFGIGKTVAGEWVEYTVDVQEEGLYSYEAYASAGAYDASFKLTLSNYFEQTALTDEIVVPCTELGNFDNYQPIHGRMLVPLAKGKQVIRLKISGGNCNIDHIDFKRLELNENMKIRVSATPITVTVGSPTTVKVTASSGVDEIKEVRLYANGVLFDTVSEFPAQTEYIPESKGMCTLSAIAVDAEGKESLISTYKINVKNTQSVYGEMAALPGIVEAENFDKGGETISFHDSDSNDEGKANYRLDNEGVDIVRSNNRYVLGYTSQNEWTEYTVDVTMSGKYEFEATVSSGTNTSAFRISQVKNGTIVNLATVSVPQTGNNNWDSYRVVKGTLSRNLTKGEAILRITITGAQCNIDKINFICVDATGIDDVTADSPWSDNKSGDGKPVIYNLSGQRLNSLQKGINIVNGKKVLVR